MNMNRPKTRNENIVVQAMENEILIYDLKENKAFCLNETSALIYQLCDGKRNVAEIARGFNEITKQPINEDLIWLALDSLKKNNLLEDESIEINFNGLNRRQVVKKIGLASLTALPIISSIVAPTAAHAASGLAALFAACTSPSQCASNFCTQGPPRCCVPGTQGIRGAPVCCDGTTANCNPQCCSNTGTIGLNPNPFPNCGFLITCPNS